MNDVTNIFVVDTKQKTNYNRSMDTNQNIGKAFLMTFIGGFAVGLLVFVLATLKEQQDSNQYFNEDYIEYENNYDYNYDYTPVEAPQTTTTLTPGEQLIDGAGSTAGDAWGQVTSPEAKSFYSNVGDSIKGGWNRFTNSFSNGLEQQREQQAP